MAKLINTSRLARKDLQAAGHEIKHDRPRILTHTARKFGPKRAEKQRVAMLLSKAERRGQQRRQLSRRRKS